MGIMENADLNNEVLVSVITVSKNTEGTIRKTIESVVNQNFCDFEFIIVDGLSNDGTMGIVKSYDTIFRNKGIKYTYVSEKDAGIYYAMNKGIDMARGEWVLFLNANDSLFSNDTLSEVFGKRYGDDVQCIYGNTINTIGDSKYVKKSFDMDVIYYKAPFIHQALFSKRDVLSKYKFNTEYKYSADYDQFVRMFVDGIRFLRIDTIISNYDMTGVSQTSDKEIAEEWKRIQKENGIYQKKRFLRFVRKLELRLKKSRFIYYLYVITKKRRDSSENTNTI